MQNKFLFHLVHSNLVKGLSLVQGKEKRQKLRPKIIDFNLYHPQQYGEPFDARYQPPPTNGTSITCMFAGSLLFTQ
jgi:hypothetical protein